MLTSISSESAEVLLLNLPITLSGECGAGDMLASVAGVAHLSCY
jgi:hypothetical protein